MNIFLEISAIFAVAAVMAFFMQAFRQPLILGHILTGILVGPAVLHILRPDQSIEVFSHLGITILLFIVGLGLNPRVVRDVGSVSVIAGIGQVLFTSIIGFGIGKALGFSAIPSLYLAVAFTFSSTIIVTKILSDKRDMHTLYGKIAIGMLLVQDLIASFALILITATMSGGNLADATLALTSKGMLIAGSLIIVSQFILPALTKSFARSQEFLFLFSISWGIGIAALFHLIGLSVELGALAAGIALSTSPYHYEISAKMKLLRDFFLVIFFIILGSQLIPGHLLAFTVPIVVYSAFILIGNPLIVIAIMGFMGYAKKTSFQTGLTMAQISEFSLILLMLGIQAGHLSANILSLAMAVGMITIACSSMMMLHADALYAFCEPLLRFFEQRHPFPERRLPETYQAILFGCHRVGADFLPSILKRHLSYLVVDFDPQMITTLKERGIHARYGDASDDGFLDSLRMDQCKLIVSTIPDHETNEYLVNSVRKVNAKAVIIVIAQHIHQAEQLYADGASYVVMPHHMGGNYAAMLVEKYGPDQQIFSTEKVKHLKHLKERHSMQAGQ
jgi:Kef-type K+ transport system membrane component KefB